MDVSVTLADTIGTVKMMHTFNNTLEIPRGFMRMNGNQITQVNYDAEHGAGAYVSDNVAGSPLNGKYIPNLINRYPVGAAATSQTGSSAITPVGNASHVVNLSHTHTLANQAGSAATFAANSEITNGYNGATNAGGSSAQNIQPDSIELIYLIRVV